MIGVIDASVALKWFFQTRVGENDVERDVERALDVLDAILNGSLRMVQPPHFLAEVAAVLARESPRRAALDMRDLMEIDSQTLSEPALYDIAMRLAVRLDHHVFDTLYHAAALHTPGAVLVTADRRYFDKAVAVGRVVWLPDFAIAH